MMKGLTIKRDRAGAGMSISVSVSIPRPLRERNKMTKVVKLKNGTEEAESLVRVMRVSLSNGREENDGT